MALLLLPITKDHPVTTTGRSVKIKYGVCRRVELACMHSIFPQTKLKGKG
jgi:hypothetical protein